MTHQVADIIGHLSYAMILLGMIFISKKKPIGWLLRLVGEIGWLCIGIVTGFSSIWVWGIVFTAMDVIGYYNWKKESKSSAD